MWKWLCTVLNGFHINISSFMDHFKCCSQRSHQKAEISRARKALFKGSLFNNKINIPDPHFTVTESVVSLLQCQGAMRVKKYPQISPRLPPTGDPI